MISQVCPGKIDDVIELLKSMGLLDFPGTVEQAGARLFVTGYRPFLLIFICIFNALDHRIRFPLLYNSYLW